MANIITGSRIVCSLALIFCPTFSTWFYVIYLLAGISDVFDGFVARYLGKETKFGAKFDTIADIVFILVVIIKVVQKINIPLWIIIWIIGITLIKCVNIISGFFIHKHFVSEHTLLNKICGILLFVIPICISVIPWQPLIILIILTCVIATIAAVQEGFYIYKGREVV